jgi:hypothetical protein
MKLKRILFFSVLLFCLFTALTSFAHDTDLYTTTGEVEPNILFILDNSGSMLGVIQGYFYDPAVTYPSIVAPAANPGKVYEYNKNGTNEATKWPVFKNTITEVCCPWGRDPLRTKGHYEGPTDCSCSYKQSSVKTLRTGNYRNFVASVGEGNVDMTKLDVAKRVLAEFINTAYGVRIGIMIFNNNYVIGTDPTGHPIYETPGGHIASWITSLNTSTRTTLINDLNSILSGPY